MSNTHTQDKMLAYMYSEAITVQIRTMRAQTWKYTKAYFSRLTEAEIKLKYWRERERESTKIGEIKKLKVDRCMDRQTNI
jgi:hypothetical protein